VSANIVTVGGVVQTNIGTQYVGPFVLVPNTAGEFAVTQINLNSGDNFIAIPTWAAFMVINPPSANTTALLFKATGSDQGFQIDPAQVCELAFSTPPPTGFVLNAASALTLPTSIIFS
jgi:hypothetical protein